MGTPEVQQEQDNGTNISNPVPKIIEEIGVKSPRNALPEDVLLDARRKLLAVDEPHEAWGFSD